MARDFTRVTQSPKVTRVPFRAGPPEIGKSGWPPLFPGRYLTELIALGAGNVIAQAGTVIAQTGTVIAEAGTVLAQALCTVGLSL